MKRIFTPSKKKSILIVDDDPFATQIYREKLEAQGFKVEVTRDFDSTLQTLKKEVFDILILDLCLPGINVVELSKNVRSESATQCVPIIVFSNPYLGNLTRAAVEEGATKFVAKVDNTPEQRIELLRELGVSASATSRVAVSGMIGTPAANSQDEAVTSPKILVVDDEVISRETICSALGRATFPAKSLDDPLAAQRLLEGEHFDLIFLDVEMPGQTGLELCVKIRGMEPNRTTPIVFVTSHSDFGSRAQSTLSGGNDFIAKPFLLVELAVKALTWLFKEGSQPLLTASVQNGVRAKAGSHKSEVAASHSALELHHRSPAT